MTTEEDFAAALDANPDDWQTRLVFADWLDERDDPRGPGYRALGVNRKWTCFRNARRGDQPLVPDLETYWWRDDGSDNIFPESEMPTDWFDSLSAHLTARSSRSKRFGSRRDADNAAALAFAKLPPERRAELLACVHPSSFIPHPF